MITISLSVKGLNLRTMDLPISTDPGGSKVIGMRCLKCLTLTMKLYIAKTSTKLIENIKGDIILC